MQIINKIIPSLLVVSSLSYAAPSVDSIGLNLGCAHINSEQTNRIGSITLINEPDEQYLHGELYALIGGIFDNKSWKPSLNYMLSGNNEFTNHLFMVGINKYFFLDGYNLYTGLLVGTGMLNWKYNPIGNTKDNDKNVHSAVGALQIGAEYPLSNSFSLGLNAKYYIHDYKTILEPTSNAAADIDHKNSCSVAIGLRYSFGADKQKSVPIVEKRQEPFPKTVAVAEIDSDNDGIADSKDKCADTPNGVQVDAKGCPLDSDNDGVADYQDSCADTQAGFSMDEKGCEKTFSFSMKFHSGSSEILPQYKSELVEYADFLTKNPGYNSEIKAYTDSIGRASDNQILSDKRARSVFNALIALGVDKDRLSYKGMGEKNPIATNDTKEGREKNRRVETTLTKIQQ